MEFRTEFADYKDELAFLMKPRPLQNAVYWLSKDGFLQCETRPFTLHFVTSVSYTHLGRLYTPQEISAMILQKMKKTAEDYLGQEVTEAVITVPGTRGDW